jgi:hypothetical protein
VKKIPNTKVRAVRVAQVVDCLPSKCEALSSDPILPPPKGIGSKTSGAWPRAGTDGTGNFLRNLRLGEPPRLLLPET